MSDLDGLVELASLAGVGLTTLPRDRGLLSKRIARSVESLRQLAERPDRQEALLVLRDCLLLLAFCEQVQSSIVVILRLLFAIGHEEKV